MPLESSPPLDRGQLEINGAIGRDDGVLSIHYELSGPLELFSIPAAAGPARRGALWEETCLEFFLAEEDAAPYWEFNLSPGGNWNVYSFASYRRGMREEPAFTSLPLTVETRPGFLRLSLKVDLAKINAAEPSLDVGVSAVVKTLEGRKTHWALVHPGPWPDFHHRDGFTLKL